MGRSSLYSGRETVRSKTWQAILYPDAVNYSCESVLTNIKQNAYKYAVILHNEDYYPRRKQYGNVPFLVFLSDLRLLHQKRYNSLHYVR